uniref:Uncharacterized protein K02A2.6-like n=1 Tax=Cicer arietinum TaxID=3827 RepID=A0A1S3E2D5_CICAR|nr:uncharacterized protein K02A2.6-like [Cicer arietinum]
MARSSDDWNLEREEIRTRLDLNEARTKKTKELLAAIASKLGVRSDDDHGDEGSEIGYRECIREKGQNRWRKLEIPIFSGEDAFGWTRKLDRYFSLQVVQEEEKMQAILLALEGRALSWFQWWERCNPNPSWDAFKVAVIRRFQPSMIQNPFELLLSLKQVGTVEEYVEEFEKYVGALREIDQEFAKGIFLNGLKEEIQVEVRLFELKSLTDVIQKALMIEQKNIILNKKGSTDYSRPTSFTRNNSFSKVVTVDSKHTADKKVDRPASGSVVNSSGSVNMNERNRSRGGEFKHLTGEEMREKREKGLCFRCDEPYSREHRCKNKQFKMLIVEEEDSSEEEDKEDLVSKQFNALHLSLCSMAGLTSSKSWKISGELYGKSMIILIDCGASHNFISQEIVSQLQLRVEPTLTYSVEVGDGHKVRCQGKCKKLKLAIQELEVEQDFYLFSLKGPDTNKERPMLPKELLGVLQEFEGVFQDPQGLPPKRKHDHAIHLKENAEVPNLRPYKCPHYKKSEIEKLVGDMLQAGVIRPSISPYSSPVILVKKKDGGWRFCVDYRALNKITIPNKFPIPIIEELLDELHGASLFSKLDLMAGYHQIRMKEEDVEKTAFRTHEGLYEFLVMPFGLSNAPSTFQALMNEVLKPFLRKFALVFFDVILVYNPDLSSHVSHLKQILELLAQHSLKANKKKCSFGQLSLEYLGHIISGEGVSADKSKVAAMQNWPIPTDIKGLRGFLGLTGYYRRFVRDYGKLAKPLTDLLKKDNFHWSEEAVSAFQSLKSAMIDLPMLAVLDFEKVFIIENDASSKGLGGVLMQEGRPLAYWSKGLSLQA